MPIVISRRQWLEWYVSNELDWLTDLNKILTALEYGITPTNTIKLYDKCNQLKFIIK